VLPESDLETGRRPVDADVGLDEAGDEHRRRAEACRYALELSQPAARVDEDAALAELSQRGRVRVT
jgi:hypothetical protein